MKLIHSPGNRFIVNRLQADAVLVDFTGDDGNFEQLLDLQQTNASHYINQGSGPPRFTITSHHSDAK